MSDSELPKGKAYGNQLRQLRQLKHGANLDSYENDTRESDLPARSTFNHYETNYQLPSPKTAERLHEHFSDLIKKEDLDQLLEDARKERDKISQRKRSISSSSTSTSGQCIPFFMDSHEIAVAQQEYDRRASEGLRESQTFILVSRSALDWIRHRQATPLKYRLQSTDFISTFILVGPAESSYMPNDQESGLASRMLDIAEAGSPGSHYEKVKSVLDHLVYCGATDDRVNVYFHAHVPPYSAAIFDEFMLFEPRYLAPNRKPESQIPFLLIERDENPEMYDYIWNDAKEVLEAAAQNPWQRWPEALMKPIRYGAFPTEPRNGSESTEVNEEKTA